MEDKEVKFNDDELIEEVSTEDDAPVEVIYRCKKCGQILTAEAKDCWKCSSKEIEEVVEEETKELKKVMLQSRIDKLEHEVKTLKKNNEFVYLALGIIVIALIIFFFTKK